MQKLNKKGFTLVELLAVIVVLAIIMIIAMPIVIKTMENARQGTFKVYAQRVLAKAEEQYQTDLLTGTGGSTCYTLDAMGMTSTGSYQGFVVVTVESASITPKFKVTLTDNNYSISGKTLEEVDALKEGSYGGKLTGNAITCPVVN